MWKTKFGTCIYTSPSGYKVYQNPLYRWLTLGSTALQTVMNRYKPYRPGLYYLPALTLMAKQIPGSTCMLGLGGAGVALMLGALKDPIPLVAVDNSEEVIDIAKRFFITDKLKNLSIVHENAMDFVRNTSMCYMHILVDLYNANHFPPECTNELFFSSCKERLNEHGFITVNLANVREQWPIFQLVKKQFKHTLVLPIQKSANMVILAAKDGSSKEFLQQIKRTGQLKRIVWIEKWGYVGKLTSSR